MKDIIDKIRYGYIVSFAVGSGIGIGIFHYKLVYFLVKKVISMIVDLQILIISRELIQAELIVILLAISLCIIKKLSDYKDNKENQEQDNNKKNSKYYIMFLLSILGINISILLELIFKNLSEGSATLIAGIIAVAGVCFTIRESQKMRLAQTITKSRIDWMQLIRKFIHEYLGCLNGLESADNLSDKRRILIELYTARDKIISYLNPEAGYLDDSDRLVTYNFETKNKYSANNKYLCCFKNNLECIPYYLCDPDCMLIKELEKIKGLEELKFINLNEHKKKIIKITRCYFKAEWERAKWEGYTGKVLNYNDIEKDKINDKFNFKKKFDSYYNKKHGDI